MDLTTGVYTAPSGGVYHFHFSGVGDSLSGFGVSLRLIGVIVGSAYALSTHDAASLHSTLQLKIDDEVDLWLGGGTLFDDSNHWSHFTGWRDDEDLKL